MGASDGRLGRLRAYYAAQVTRPTIDWSQWDQERTTARRILRDNPLALAELNETIRRYRMDEPHALSYEAWLTFLNAVKAALEPVCDTGALADALAASRAGQAS